MYSNLDVILNGTFGALTFANTACDGCPLGGSSVGLIDSTLASDFFLQDFQVDFAGGAFGGGLTVIFRGNSFAVEDPNGHEDDGVDLTTPGIGFAHRFLATDN